MSNDSREWLDALKEADLREKVALCDSRFKAASKAFMLNASASNYASLVRHACNVQDARFNLSEFLTSQRSKR